MGIRFFCPNGHKLNVKSFQAGRKGFCPYCGVKVEIPFQSTSAPSKGAGATPSAESPKGASAPLPALEPFDPMPLLNTPSPLPKPSFQPLGGANPVVGASPTPAFSPYPSVTPTAPLSPIPSMPAAGAMGPATTSPSPAPMPAPFGATPGMVPMPGMMPMPVATPMPTATPMPAFGAMPTPAYAAPTAMPAMPMGQPVVMPHGFSAAPPSPPSPPTAPDPLAEAPDAVWYVRPPSGGQYGPAASPVMRSWIQEGRVSADSLVWREGWPDWREAQIVFPQLSGGGAAAEVPAVDLGLGAPLDVRRNAQQNEFDRKDRRTRLLLVLAMVLCVVVLVIVFFVVLFHGARTEPSDSKDDTPPAETGKASSTDTSSLSNYLPSCLNA